MQHFATYFNSHYLTTGITLYRSLRRHAGEFRLHVLCLDDDVRAALDELSLGHVVTTSLDEVEAFDSELHSVRGSRRPVEYFFTMTATFPRYLLETEDIDRITHLGSDLYFFSSLAPLMAEVESGSVAVHTHRFPPGREDLERFGLYNADFISFSADETGRRCLENYRRNCIDWCYDRVEDGKFANQRYLDEWPERYDDVVVVDHPGAGLAYWNQATHSVSLNDGEVRVDDEPLVFYHFSDLERVTDKIWNPPIPTMNRVEKYDVYLPYVRERAATGRWLADRTDVGNMEGSIRYQSESVLSSMTIKEVRRTGIGVYRLLKQGLRGNLLVVGAI